MECEERLNETESAPISKISKGTFIRCSLLFAVIMLIIILPRLVVAQMGSTYDKLLFGSNEDILGDGVVIQSLQRTGRVLCVFR